MDLIHSRLRSVVVFFNELACEDESASDVEQMEKVDATTHQPRLALCSSHEVFSLRLDVISTVLPAWCLPDSFLLPAGSTASCAANPSQLMRGPHSLRAFLRSGKPSGERSHAGMGWASRS